jgi:O-antigen ligase
MVLFMYRVERILFYLLILLIPTQFGKHFWPDFTIVSGIRIDYLSPIIYLTDILLFVLFGFVISRWIRTETKSKRKSQNLKLQFKNQKFLLIGGLGMLLFFCNIIFSSRPLLSIYGTVKLTEFVFLGVYVAKTIKYQTQLQRIALVLAISSLFESFLAIAQYLHQGSLNGIFYFLGERTFTGMTPGIANVSIEGVLVLRPYGTFSHPNVLAGYLLISMIIIWSFFASKMNRWFKILSISSLLLSSIALLLTFSRISILLWILLLLVVLWQVLSRSFNSLYAKFAFISLAFLVLFSIGATPLGQEVFTRFTQSSFSDESVTERTELLSTAFTMIRQHPIFGVGLYNFIPAMAPLQKPLPLGLYLQPVHNIFVLVAAETGLVGLGLFMWLLIATIQRITSSELRIKSAYYVLILIILLTGTFDHYWLTLQQGQLLFALVLGMCWIRLQKS